MTGVSVTGRGTGRNRRTVAEITDAVHKGRIGHTEAIEALRLKTYHDLVDTMHANGLPLWAHRAGKRPSRDILDLLASACGRTPGTAQTPTDDDAPGLIQP